MTAADDNALLTLLGLLRERDYRFVTPTPATHGRVISRPDRREANCLEDALGWSLPFRPGLLGAPIEELLLAAGMIEQRDGLLRSLIRVSSLYDCLFLHSAYPTDQREAVFFGPDSYRFADLIAAELADCRLDAGRLIVDIGSGAGVGAIVAGRLCPEAAVAMTEINPLALRFGRINAAAAGIDVIALHTARLEGLEGSIDVALANPPYLADGRQRLYRDGGGRRGERVTLDMTAFILPRLASGGRLILYSGSAILKRRDLLKEALQSLASDQRCTMRYREIDPDVFGEELEHAAYTDVDRIALVAAVIERP